MIKLDVDVEIIKILHWVNPIVQYKRSLIKGTTCYGMHVYDRHYNAINILLY